MRFDHLVVAAETLETGVDHVERCVGVTATRGGAHEFMGTHNALISLGPDAYLEIIAIDPDARAPGHARWFALDAFRGPPRLTNWVCRSDDLSMELRRAPPEMGPITDASRGRLHWQMAVPEGGQYPHDGGFPGMIGWMSGGHPAKRLPDYGLRLDMLEIGCKEADKWPNR